MGNDEPATDKQLRYIYALEKELGRVPLWREGVSKVFAMRLIEELVEQLDVPEGQRG